MCRFLHPHFWTLIEEKPFSLIGLLLLLPLHPPSPLVTYQKLETIFDIINDTSQPLWWSSLGILYERKKNLIEIIVETLSVVEGFAR